MEPVKMYKTVQIVRHNLPVELPKCMYKMKNLQETSSAPINGIHVAASPKNLSISEKVKQFLQAHSAIPEMAALQERQEKILQQLNDLKKQVDTLKVDLKSSQKDIKINKVTIGKMNKPPATVDVSKLPDLIVNASPASPPYSLQLIQKILVDSVHLSISCHLHSTVPSIPKEAQALATKLESFRPKNNVPVVKLRLIWKKVESQMELIINSMPIVGEANMLRYLSRVIPSLGYEANNAFEVDSALDTSFAIAESKTKTERASLLTMLNKKLGKNQYICGSEVSIADFSAYAAIKQKAGNEANVNLTKWLQRIEAL